MKKKKILALVLAGVMCCSTFAGCGNKETSENVAEEQVVDETIADEEAANEEKTEAPKEYTKEDIINAIDFKNGVEFSLGKDGYDMVMGVKASEEEPFVSARFERDVDGTRNKGGFYLVGNEIYYFVGANDELFLTGKASTEGNDLSSVAESQEEMANGFVASEDALESFELIETKEYNGAEYDVVAVKAKSQYYDTYKEMLDASSEETAEDDEAAQADKELYESLMYQKMVYYFNKETGKVDYIEANETNDEEQETYMIALTYPESFEKPEWFEEAEEVDSDKALGMLLTVMFLPMSEEALTAESVAEMGDFDLGSLFSGLGEE